MKKLAIFAFFCTLSFGLAAEITESDLYYVNVKIIRAFMHTKGYYIVYRTSGMGTAEAFIPYSWFKPAEKKATLRKCTGRIDPYLSIFTKEGEFDHLTLVLPLEDPKAPVWGVLRAPTIYDDKFDIDTIEFEF